MKFLNFFKASLLISPFFFLAQSYALNIVNNVVNNVANNNANNNIINYKNNCSKKMPLPTNGIGLTPLHLALEINDIKSVEKILFKNCFDPNLGTYGELQIKPILSVKSLPAYKLLIAAGVDSDIKNDDGERFLNVLFTLPDSYSSKLWTEQKKDISSLAINFINYIEEPKLNLYLTSNNFPFVAEYNNLLLYVINNNDDLLTVKDRSGITPLHWLVYYGRYELFKKAFTLSSASLKTKTSSEESFAMTAINHYCHLPNDRISDMAKINFDILNNKEIFKFNNSDNFEWAKYISYLRDYEKSGHQEVLIAIIAKLKEKQKELVKRLNVQITAKYKKEPYSNLCEDYQYNGKLKIK